ncbi:MAG: haloacid dehalogenase type II [Pseudomonadota bacterium]
MTSNSHDTVKAVLFDVFGTVVDWRTSVTRELRSFGHARGLDADWESFADEWRSLYQPAMEEIRAGRRPFTILDTLHRENLDTLLARHNFPQFTESELEHLVTIWHRLEPWPDVIEGLYRLKRRYIIATLSNGNIGLMVRMARHSGLPWDTILGAEVTKAYKPTQQAYLGCAQALNLKPDACMLVAAHNDDLRAAQNVGFRTAFVLRPTEHGPAQTKDKHATAPWDIVTDSLNGVADALGCQR